jgi:DNA-binding IscR family transcriptional regulator
MRMSPLVALMLISFVASAQESKPASAETVAASVGAPWAFLAGNFVALADAMPAEKYGFAPTQGEFAGVRTFGEQVKHVACANYGFFSEIEGTTPPGHCWDGGPSPATTKAELVAYLRDSFAYGSRVAATLDQKNLLEAVDGPYGGPRTKLGIAVLAIWHASDHYGQLVEYLRMNGIVPPASHPAPAK